LHGFFDGQLAGQKIGLAGCYAPMEKSSRKVSALKMAAHDFITQKSEREAARLLGRQAHRNLKRRKRGKLLTASNHWQK
jgi:hypothetical protein